jgi:hypothetical protein
VRFGGPEEKKAFCMKDTPRKQSESSGTWVQRIWDECDKYDTKCPEVLTMELLETYSRGDAKSGNDNLPPIPPKNAKSFRSVAGATGNSAKAAGRRSDATT